MLMRTAGLAPALPPARLDGWAGKGYGPSQFRDRRGVGFQGSAELPTQTASGDLDAIDPQETLADVGRNRFIAPFMPRAGRHASMEAGLRKRRNKAIAPYGPTCRLGGQPGGRQRPTQTH